MSIQKKGKVHIPSATIEVIEDSYLELNLTDNILVDQKLMHMRDEVILQMCGNKSMPIVSYLSDNILHFTPDIRDYSPASNGIKHIKAAEAIVTNNTSLQTVLQAYIDKLNEFTPTRLFEYEEEAIKWIRQFIT